MDIKEIISYVAIALSIIAIVVSLVKTGPKGPKGDTGATGSTGNTGPKGDPGTSSGLTDTDITNVKMLGTGFYLKVPNDTTTANGTPLYQQGQYVIGGGNTTPVDGVSPTALAFGGNGGWSKFMITSVEP